MELASYHEPGQISVTESRHFFPLFGMDFRRPGVFAESFQYAALHVR
jgi:hypothetical protein